MIAAVLLLLGVPAAAYLLPAVPREFRQAAVLWGLVGAGLALAFLWAHLVPYQRTDPQDWGGALQRTTRAAALLGWAMAAAVQGLRHLLRRMRAPRVLHGLAVAAGAVPILLFIANS